MKVWVTRDEPPHGPLSRALEAAGVGVILAPVIRRQPVGDAARELARLGPDGWLVITSEFALRCMPPPALRGRRAAVVGARTAKAAVEAGLRVEIIGGGGAEELFALMRARGVSGRILYPRTDIVRPPRAWPGVLIESPVVYRTLPMRGERTLIARADAAAFTSPATVRAAGRVALPAASLGPTTSAALARQGMAVWVQASEPTFEALARAIAGAKG